ncbi:MAG: DUF3298 and DUF4163 domain-containing protein [Ectobacillus sp.]
MKKLLYIALIAYFFTIIVPKYVFAYHPAVSRISQAASVETEKKQGKTEYFEYQLHLPVFTGISNHIFQKRLNNYYKTNILSFKKKLEKEAKKYYDGAQQKPLSIHPYIANVDHKVTYNKKPLLSLYINYYQYTGGAHGMYDWRANTFDIETGKELTLADLFQKNSDYTNKIQQEIIRQIAQNKESFFPDAIEQVKKGDSFRFFLEPEHLTVYFPLYEIAPYASGIPQFRIPYTLLENDLKGKYKKILLNR